MKKNNESQELTGKGFQESRMALSETHSERLHSAVRESLRVSLNGDLQYSTQTMTETIYNELAQSPIQKKEPMALLHSNMETLEGLIQRWSFIMKENRYLLKVENEE